LAKKSDLDALDDVAARDHLAEDHVLAVEMRNARGRQEELAVSVCVCESE
jgi:hypothetical protein